MKPGDCGLTYFASLRHPKVSLGMEVLKGGGNQLWTSIMIFEDFHVSGLKLIKPGVACML